MIIQTVLAAVALAVGALGSIYISAYFWCFYRPGQAEMSCDNIMHDWVVSFFVFGFIPLILLIGYLDWWWSRKRKIMLAHSVLLGIVYGLLLLLGSLIYFEYDGHISDPWFVCEVVVPLTGSILLVVYMPWQYFIKNKPNN